MTVVAPLTTAAADCVTAPPATTSRVVAPIAASTTAFVSVISTFEPVTAIELKLFAPCVSVTSLPVAVTVVAPLTTAAADCVTAPPATTSRVVAPIAASTTAFVSVISTFEPVTAIELKLFELCVSVTLLPVAVTVVAPLTTAAADCVTAPLAITSRVVALIAASTTPFASVMSTFEPVTAIELKLFAACVRVTSLEPAETVVAPAMTNAPAFVIPSEVTESAPGIVTAFNVSTSAPFPRSTEMLVTPLLSTVPMTAVSPLLPRFTLSVEIAPAFVISTSTKFEFAGSPAIS